MATLRVYQGPEDMHPTVTIRETGEPLKGVRRVEYEHLSGEWPLLTLELVPGIVGNEIDLTITVQDGDAEDGALRPHITNNDPEPVPEKPATADERDAIPEAERCIVCDGAGRKPDARDDGTVGEKDCAACQGTGRLKQALAECPECEGDGRIITTHKGGYTERACERCGGKGYLE